MKQQTVLVAIFACAGLAAPSIAAPAASFPRTESVPDWTCISLSGYNESTPVTLVGANAACYSSDGGPDCAWYPSLAACASAGAPRSDAATLICGSEIYYKQFGDYGYGNRDSWCCLALKAFSGNNSVTRPSSLPDAVPFECSSLGLTSPSANNLDTADTVCNALTDPILVVDGITKAKDLVALGACSSYSNMNGKTLIIYRFTGGDSYTAAALIQSENPLVNYPIAKVSDQTRQEFQTTCYYHFPSETQHKFSEGEKFSFYKYGHFQVSVTRNPDASQAKQFVFNIEILEGQIFLDDAYGPCSNIDLTITYPLSAVATTNPGPGDISLDTGLEVCNRLQDPILVHVDVDEPIKHRYLIAPQKCLSFTPYHKQRDFLVYRFTGGDTYTASAFIRANNPPIGYPIAAVTDLSKKGYDTEYCYPDPPKEMQHGFFIGEWFGFYKYGHYQMSVVRNPDSYSSKWFSFNVEILEGQITLAGGCPNIDLTLTWTDPW